MAKLPAEVKSAIEKQDVIPVATSDQDCVPNVVYIAYLKVMDDETILIADNYLDKTRRNILSNGNISFVVHDQDKGSYQVKGKAQRFTEGEMFEEVKKWVSDKLPKEAAVVMKVEKVYNGAKWIS
jgi:uncharacterized protein